MMLEKPQKHIVKIEKPRKDVPIVLLKRQETDIMTEECKEAILAYGNNPHASVWSVIERIYEELTSYILRKKDILKKIYEEIIFMENDPMIRFVPEDDHKESWDNLYNILIVLIGNDFKSISRNYEPNNPKYVEKFEEYDECADNPEDCFNFIDDIDLAESQE